MKNFFKKEKQEKIKKRWIMSKALLVREVILDGEMVMEFNLFHYKHTWITPYLLAVEQKKGWVLYEVLKYEPGFLLVKEIETKDELLNLNLIRR
jgi:hypothetical protein